MALQSLNAAIQWPGLVPNTGTAPTTAAGATIDAAGEYDGAVFCAPFDMTISHVGWRVNTVSGSPTCDVRIETVAATGLPSGTLWATNTNVVTGVMTAAWRLDALTASASITKGQLFAVKFLHNTGTSFTIRLLSSYGISVAGLPYRISNTGTPAKASMNGINCCFGSSSTTFYSLFQAIPVTTINNNIFNNLGSAARGNRFQVPFKCRVAGLAWIAGTSVGDFNAVLYDDSGNELSSSSTAFDGDYKNAAAGAQVRAYFDNPVTLSPGAWYRMALEPSSATNINQTVFGLSSADYRTAMPGGTNFHYATRAGGTWTDTTTSVALMDLLIDQLDDGVSGAVGGGLLRGLVG